MTQPGYQEGGERAWWWKVAQHLDAAALAAVNAMAHNLDDSARVRALQDKLRDAQAILLEIFCAKGLLPAASNGAAVPVPPAVFVPAPEGVDPEVPEVAQALAAQEAAAYEAAMDDEAPPEAVAAPPVIGSPAAPEASSESEA